MTQFADAFSPQESGYAQRTTVWVLSRHALHRVYQVSLTFPAEFLCNNEALHGTRLFRLCQAKTVLLNYQLGAHSPIGIET